VNQHETIINRVHSKRSVAVMRQTHFDVRWSALLVMQATWIVRLFGVWEGTYSILKNLQDLSFAVSWGKLFTISAGSMRDLYRQVQLRILFLKCPLVTDTRKTSIFQWQKKLKKLTNVSGPRFNLIIQLKNRKRKIQTLLACPNLSWHFIDN